MGNTVMPVFEDSKEYQPDMPMGDMHYVLRIPLPAPDGVPFSEFNHHLAGFIVLIIGLSAVAIHYSPDRLRFLRYIWPIALVVLGIYLIIYSDPDSWPTSYRTLAASLQDPETRQHKVFALLLILMGSIELLRAAGTLANPKWNYAFPALAALGAIYLIFHRHGGHGEGMNMDTGSMTVIFYQHIAYIVTGIAIAVTKILYDTGRLRGRIGALLWPCLTIILGLMLIKYHE